MQNTSFSYRITSQWQAALQRRTDIFIIQLGTNDAKRVHWNSAKYKAAYSEIIHDLRAKHPKAQIILVKPPPLARDGVCGGMVKSVLDTNIPQTIDEVSQEAGLEPAVDFFGMFDPQLFEHPGDCHPNDAGYKEMAQVFAKRLLSIAQ
eukprot:TRINITY_DN65675_c0_g1_i1.p1 TRINITY_DN65675_c0_g1~~TRINITY_DN65675_c0_g1_i1.p1  ORF type:complete len:157 (+),score=32.14 TRINITY_DN65675_c0_g1_i1:29-472(+)